MRATLRNELLTYALEKRHAARDLDARPSLNLVCLSLAHEVFFFLSYSGAKGPSVHPIMQLIVTRLKRPKAEE